MLASLTSVFGFFSNGWMKWIGIAVLVLGVVFYIGHLRIENAEKQIEIERTQAELIASRAAEGAAKATIAELEAGKAATEKALAEREKIINIINHQHAMERRRWKEAKRHDPETRSWADIPLPDTVRGLLQQ